MTKDKILAIALIGLALLGIILSLFSPVKQSKNDSTKTISSFGKNLSGGGDKILSLELNGALMDGQTQSFLGGDKSEAVKVRDELNKAAEDKSIKGVLLRINSPGVAVGISQELYQAVKRVRKTKPIITTMGDVAASGGYYTASACDYIFANPGTLTGSIGVISHFLNLEGLYGKVGVKDMTIKAGKYKDIGSPGRSMTAEERQILQSLINDTYNQFINDVYEGRRANSNEYGEKRKNLSRNYIENVAEGLIYTGKQAKEIGLVDKLGDSQDALNELQKIIKKRSKGKIKDDLEVVDSLESTASSLREMIGLSMPFKFDILGLNSIINNQQKPNTAVISQINQQQSIKLKMPIMLIAPEFIDNI